MFYKTLTILAFFNLFSLTNTNALQVSDDAKVIAEDTDKATTKKVVTAQIIEISPYDDYFRSISEQEGNDWRLLCAMAYHESRFQPDVVSRCGARGIMQVMPRVAKQFDISPEQLNNVEDNIWVANKVISLIDDMLKLPASMPADERLKFTIAAYNCGVGRIADARRLARSFGEDSTSWDVIAQYLKKMNNPTYYEQDAVKYGRFTGAGQTLAYVDNVLNHYESYCLLAIK